MYGDRACKECGAIQNPRNVTAAGVCGDCLMGQFPAGGKVVTLPDGATVIDCGPCVPAAGIEGVGKDAPTVTNAAGGKQSHSPYRADLLPPHALLAVAKVLSEGAAKYGANNWHAIPAADNINHALVHLLALQAGDTSDEHLEHAATRILFALDQVRSGREAKLTAPKPLDPKLGPIYTADELERFRSERGRSFAVGDRVIANDKWPGVVAEPYTGGRFVRVRLDEFGEVGGWYPENVAKIAGAEKGGASC